MPDETTLTSFQARVVEALARIETGQQDMSRRITDHESRLTASIDRIDRDFVRREQGEQMRADIYKIEGLLNKAIWGIFGIVSSLIVSVLSALLKFGVPK